MLFSKRGEKVCLLVDTSNQHCLEESVEVKDVRLQERKEFTSCKQNLQQLFESQLSRKKCVYLSQCGSEAAQNQPLELNFKDYKER